MCTNLEEQRQHTFIWKSENFSFCTQKKGDNLVSTAFVAESLNRTKWYLSLYPRGDKNVENGYLSLYLHRSKNDEGLQEIECEYKLEIIAADKKPLMSQKSAHKFLKGNSSGWRNFMKNDLLLNTGVSEDTVTIKCYLMGKIPIPKTILASENTCLTRIGIVHCSFTWTVKNLNSSCTEVIKFPSSGASQIEISIQVPEEDIKIDVRKAEVFSGPQSVKCKIALLDVKGQEQDSRRGEHLFEKADLSDKNDTWEFPTFIKKCKLNSEESKYLKNDSFTLLCEVSISNGMTSEIVQEKKSDFSCGEISAFSMDDTVGVLRNMKHMYSCKIQTDVKLHVDNQVFHAHKFILSSRSPVFLAMFDKDMTESQTGSVNIPDLEAKIVESLLEYMYTGTVEHLDGDIAMKLIVGADKYQVLSLKEKYADFLTSVLSDERVCDILVIAELLPHDRMKTSAIAYIKGHSKTILLSEKWKLCVEKNLKLATETICQISTLLAVET